MRRMLIGMTLAIEIAACSQEPRLEAKTQAEFEASYLRFVASLKSTKREEFDQALKDIVLVEAGIYDPNGLSGSDPMNIPSNLAVDETPTTTMFDSIMATVINSAWTAQRGNLVIQHAGPIIDSHTASEVIAIAENERRRALDVALGKYRGQLAQSKDALAAVQQQISEAHRKAIEQQSILDQIVLSNARFHYSTDSFLSQPTISFRIHNGGQVPIKHIYVSAILQTAGRAVPWVEDSFNYEFSGGLEPAESQQLDLAPNMFGNWSKVPKTAVDGTILTLRLTAIEDASGTKIGGTEESDGLRRRERALTESIERLKTKIADLEAEVATSAQEQTKDSRLGDES